MGSVLRRQAAAQLRPHVAGMALAPWEAAALRTSGSSCFALKPTSAHSLAAVAVVLAVAAESLVAETGYLLQQHSVVHRLGPGERPALAPGPGVYSVFFGEAARAGLPHVNAAPGNILLRVEGWDLAVGAALAGV